MIVCVHVQLTGGKKTSYVPSIFGAKNSQKYEQQQRRYEALEHRRQRKEQVEAASALLQLNTGEEHPVPEEQDELVLKN